MPFSQPYL